MIIIFEKYWTENELKIPKLYNHLITFFKNFYFSVYYSRAVEEYNKCYFYKNKNDILFYIRTSDNSLVFHMSNNIISNIVKFIPIYFKTINGLIVKYHQEGHHQFEVYISNDADIDDIINKITKKDFNLKLNTNKYNI